MTPSRSARPPRRHELTASDGFGALLTSVPGARSRSFTRGLCSFLLWPYRRIPAVAPLSQPELHSAAIPLRAANR